MIALKRSLTLVFSLLTVSGPALAEDSSELAWHRQTSLEGTLGGRTLAVYQRKAGGNRERTASALLKSLVPKLPSAGALAIAGEPTKIRSSDSWTVFQGGGWRLRVAGAGEKASYHEHERLARVALERQLPRAAAPRIRDLEDRARKFIQGTLKDAIKLGRSERLITWRARHHIESDMERASGRVTEHVAATVLEFKREIAGIPVLGAGSSVSITFAADGSIAGFDYDWSDFEPSVREARTVDRARLEHRLERVRTSRQLKSAPGTPRPSGGAATAPAVAQRATERKEHGLICGYFDPGSESEVEGSELEPVCVKTYTIRDVTTGLEGAYIDVVPADQTLKPRNGWAETKLLLPTD
jgi:hypothetical protein